VRRERIRSIRGRIPKSRATPSPSSSRDIAFSLSVIELVGDRIVFQRSGIDKDVAYLHFLLDLMVDLAAAVEQSLDKEVHAMALFEWGRWDWKP